MTPTDRHIEFLSEEIIPGFERWVYEILLERIEEILNKRQIDFVNLYITFDGWGAVTRCAEEMGVSVSAVSQRLENLRRLLTKPAHIVHSHGNPN